MSIESVFKSGTAVITGAGSGIGEAMAKLAAKNGMNVVVAELSEERGIKVAKDINSSGGQATFIKTDVGSAESVNALSSKAYEIYGDVQLLVNNAGISTLGAIWEISEQDWHNTMNVNVHGPINGIRAFVPRMLQSDKPCYISNVASTAGILSLGFCSTYFSSKHALVSITESLYLEMQQKPNPINVSLIMPGMIATRFMEDMNVANSQYDGQMSGMRSHIAKSGMSVDAAAQIFLEEIAEGRYWITSHKDELEVYAKSRANYLLERGFPKAVEKDLD
jgi:short-subunit dehydrogenase